MPAASLREFSDLTPTERAAATRSIGRVVTEHLQDGWEPWELPMIAQSAANLIGVHLSRSERDALL